VQLVIFYSQLNPYIMMWTTRTGEKIAIDDMDINHLRNALKMMIRKEGVLLSKINEVVEKHNGVVKMYNEAMRNKFQREFANGRINRQFQNQEIEENYSEDFEDSLYNV
jgi:hypothetical protein